MIWSHFHQVMYFTELYCVYIVINGYPNSQTFYPHRSTSCQEAGLYSCEELHYYLVQKVMLHISFFCDLHDNKFLDYLTLIRGGDQLRFFFLKNRFRDRTCTWKIYPRRNFWDQIWTKFPKVDSDGTRKTRKDPCRLKIPSRDRKVVELWFWLHLNRLEE